MLALSCDNVLSLSNHICILKIMVGKSLSRLELGKLEVDGWRLYFAVQIEKAD